MNSLKNGITTESEEQDYPLITIEPINRKIKILHLEDLQSDVELIGNALRKGRIDFERVVVDSREKFLLALESFSPDIILADHALPSFDSHEALAIVQKKRTKIPFLLITGAMSDEFAVDIIKRGADDYILKDRLSRLPTAVRNTMEKFRAKKERQNFLDDLIRNERRYRALVECGADAIVILDENGQAMYASPSIHRILGYTEDEVMGLDIASLIHPDDVMAVAAVMAECIEKPGIPVMGHTGRIKNKKGEWRWIEATITNWLDDPAIRGIVDNFRDVTEKKLAEAQIIHQNRLYAFLSQINQAIVHAVSEETIFREACRIAFETGKLKVGWIGLFDTGNEKISLAEQYGIPDEDIFRFANADLQKNGPQDMVLRTGSYYCCNDIQNAPEIGAWRPLASKRGYNSCMVLPIRRSGAIVGTFNLYASERDFFKAEEIALLVEAASDISYALGAIEKERMKLLADEKLVENESRLVRAQAIAHLGSWTLDFATGIAIWTEEACRICGLAVDDCVQSAESWASFIHPEDYNYVMGVVKESRASLSSNDFHYRILRKDGSIRHLHSQAVFQFDKQGDPIGLYGVMHDVTEIKEVEYALKESEQILTELVGFNQQLLDVSPMGIASYNGISGMCTSANPAFTKIVSATKDEVMAQNFRQLESWEKFGLLNDAEDTLLSGRMHHEEVHAVSTFGNSVWMDYMFIRFYNKDQPHLLMLANDISDRKKAEQSLLRTESNLKAIIENTDATIYSLDRDFRFITFNQRLYDSLNEIYGLDIQQGSHVYNFLEKLAPEEALGWKEIYSKALDGEAQKFEKHFSFNGGSAYNNFSIHPIQENGIVTGLSCFVVDITRERLTELELRQAETRYKDLFQLSPQPKMIYEKSNFKFLQVNAACIQHYGYTEEEFLGMHVTDILSKANADEYDVHSGATMQKHCKKSGEIIDVQIFSTDLTIGEKACKSMLAIDVTEKNNFELLLIDAAIKAQEVERYEIGSELHDNVCQILATSNFSLSLLKDSVSASGIALLQQCREQITMASKEIRVLSHRLAPASYDSRTLEEDFTELLQRFNSDGTYDISIIFDDSRVHMDLSQDLKKTLYRILQEQLQNIKKYANATGIEIKVGVINDRIIMKIADNGCGFDAEIASHGIGVANMKRRVVRFAGSFKIVSSPGSGCQIQVEIPLLAGIEAI